jgi:hypothetical protein
LLLAVASFSLALFLSNHWKNSFDYYDTKTAFKHLEFRTTGILSDGEYVQDVNTWAISISGDPSTAVPKEPIGMIRIGNPFPGLLPDRDYYVRSEKVRSRDDIILYDTRNFSSEYRFRLYADGRYDYSRKPIVDGLAARERR